MASSVGFQTALVKSFRMRSHPQTSFPCRSARNHSWRGRRRWADHPPREGAGGLERESPCAVGLDEAENWNRESRSLRSRGKPACNSESVSRHCSACRAERITLRAFQPWINHKHLLGARKAMVCAGCGSPNETDPAWQSRCGRWRSGRVRVLIVRVCTKSADQVWRLVCAASRPVQTESESARMLRSAENRDADRENNGVLHFDCWFAQTGTK